MIGSRQAIAIGSAAASLLLAVPGPAAPRPQPRQAPLVRLLVPLETGHELQQLLPVAPQAQLVQLEGSLYVQLGTYADARVAYRLGRTFQQRLRLPFSLAYDGGHPQSSGTWLAQERAAEASPSLARVGSPSAGDAGARAAKPGSASLFVRLKSPGELMALRRHAAVEEMVQRDGQLYARVGVYPPSPAGRRSLDEQRITLVAKGYVTEVIAMNP